MSKTIIKNGFVIDPSNKIDGERMDILVQNGRIVEKFEGGENNVLEVNASGKTVMTGGFDIHTHIAGANLTAARCMMPQDAVMGVRRGSPYLRAEAGKILPNSFGIGQRYTEMGFTFVVQPGMSGLQGRETHAELNDIPFVDKVSQTYSDKNWFLVNYLRDDEFEKAKNFLAWLLAVSKSTAPKIVNPGGTEAWAFGKNVYQLDDEVPHFNVTPREIILWIARLTEELDLPHSIHLHLNSLGIPGNYDVTLDTFKALEKVKKSSNVTRPQTCHITHLQFNAFGGESWKDASSAAEPLAKYLNAHDHLTIDVGNVVFGLAMTITADGPVEYSLAKITGMKWSNNDVEIENGAGVVPMLYRPKSRANTIQWACGIELYLLIDDPWKVMLSTDHPNGGLFTDYPEIMAYLVSKDYRDKLAARCHKDFEKATILSSLDREYSLSELAVISRAACAKSYGLEDRGHLGLGAVGDVAVYNINPEIDELSREAEKLKKAFRWADAVIKDGKVLIKDREFKAYHQGKLFWLNRPHNGIEKDIREPFQQFYSVNFDNYPISESYLVNPELLSSHGKLL
ncbi:MAG: formylmethanofuran dehydrogenase subunit A [Candidatus Hodarchaeales archaeon]|jgi:formylmethanofuran dehydrogenase subunit A